jgi:hypothetical protein
MAEGILDILTDKKNSETKKTWKMEYRRRKI